MLVFNSVGKCMAKSFSTEEWEQINNQLDGRLAEYGFPERRDNSIVFASWNIRKFGALLGDQNEPKKSNGSMDMFVRFCSNCDLIAIQELLSDTSSLLHLVDRLNQEGNGHFDYIISDVTGRKPGGRSLAERFGFVFNTDRVNRGHVASDLTFDRTAVLDHINSAYKIVFDTRFASGANAGLIEKIMNWLSRTGSEAGKKIKTFVQFIRSPHMVEFIVTGEDGSDYQLYCVNAHLVSGASKTERENEFFALLEWLLIQSKKDVTEDGKAFMLMADLNLDFKSSADKRKKGIEEYVTSINSSRNLSAKVNFPFLDPPHYTNARKSETFDHIALIVDDDRWPRARNNSARGTLGAEDFDYRMFDFVRLFMDSGPGQLSAGKPDYAKFEHDFTDHMPIWLRMPMPRADQRRYPL